RRGAALERVLHRLPRQREDARRAARTARASWLHRGRLGPPPRPRRAPDQRTLARRGRDIDPRRDHPGAAPHQAMIFGPLPLDDARGAVAGHTLRLGEGGVVMKGSVLDEGQIAALRAAGHVEVIAARLDDDDVGENEAASRIAAAVAGLGVRRSEATTGRCNLHAPPAGWSWWTASASTGSISSTRR